MFDFEISLYLLLPDLRNDEREVNVARTQARKTDIVGWEMVGGAAVVQGRVQTRCAPDRRLVALCLAIGRRFSVARYRFSSTSRNFARGPAISLDGEVVKASYVAVKEKQPGCSRTPGRFSPRASRSETRASYVMRRYKLRAYIKLYRGSNHRARSLRVLFRVKNFGGTYCAAVFYIINAHRTHGAG